MPAKSKVRERSTSTDDSDSETRKATVRKRAKKASDSEAADKQDENHQAIEQAIETAEKLAESQMEMARLFLERGKPEIARRRLLDVIERFERSAAAKQARQMLRQMEASR